VPFIYPTPSFICDPFFFFSLLHSLAPLCVGVQILKYEWITPKKLLLKFEVNSKSSRGSERKERERERKQIMLQHYSSTHSDLLFNSSSSPCTELRLSSHWWKVICSTISPLIYLHYCVGPKNSLSWLSEAWVVWRICLHRILNRCQTEKGSNDTNNNGAQFV